MPIGKCTNYGNCEIADEGKPISAPASDFFCTNPECGKELIEIKSQFQIKSIYKIIFGVAAILILLSLLSLKYFFIGNDAQQPKPSPIKEKSEEILNKKNSKEPREELMYFPVPAGEYPIPEYFKRYIRYISKDKIIIDKPFSVQIGEVTVAEFRKYFETREEIEKEHIGIGWGQNEDGKPYNDKKPVEHVSWRNASEYAKWLSEQEKQDFRLPTLDQWIAACIKYGEDQPIMNIDVPLETLRSQPDHLIGNLREWSFDACENGNKHKHRILGENYLLDITEPLNVGKGYCEIPDESWSGVGFRLIRVDTLRINKKEQP